ncbi:MAG: carbohydrate binding family 9 domain-containing protein, partial [Gemmatimonadetes bacterium]|nr:carbohydrate binding family 9 domain-containing protein [Gemmatimonadota bacterium]
MDRPLDTCGFTARAAPLRRVGAAPAGARRTVALLVMAFACARVAPAQASAGAERTARVPVVRAATMPIRLDGRVDEPAWAAADSIDEFTQVDPEEGVPGSERTVVRFLRTPAGLWIGIIAYDGAPALIRRAQLRRDAAFASDDHVRVMLSPMRDRRTGILLTVNANGMQHDADIVTFESENDGWDGVWDARAQVTDRGWEAELFVPWASLRYPDASDAWDVNIERFIRRKNETQRWRSWKRTQGIRLLENAGQLAGLAGLPPRARVELRPYVASTLSPAERDYGAQPPAIVAPASLHGDVGLDAKVAPTATTTLDLTLNADFAQADVDNQVINFTRFPLFFPERRSFFTENAGVFDFGRVGQTQLFYSRRIGLTPDGLPVPLLAGARLTGRLLDQQVGVIAARTGGARQGTSAVVRLKHDVLERGWVGAMSTVEAVDGQRASLTAGLDYNFPFVVGGQNLIFLGLASFSRDSAGGAPRGFGRFVVDFPNDLADIVVRFDHVEAGFDPTLGFVQQAGINRLSGTVNLTPRPTRWGIRKLSFLLPEYDVVLNPDGSLNNATVNVEPLGVRF